jgi:regulator of replication initiation timing
MTRICRTEKFIPRTGNPVFQVQEEADFGGTLQLLPPRVPTAKELADQQDAFAASQQSRISELETELASAKQSLEAKTQEASTLTTERDSLRSQLDAANEELAEKTEELIEARETIAEKDARIAKLLEEVPFDPRDIHLNAFKARLYKVLSPADLIRLYAADADPVLKQIASTIVAWEDKYPIRLDSRELREPLGYLLAVQLITEEEQAYLVSDSTRAEAFFPADVAT